MMKPDITATASLVSGYNSDVYPCRLVRCDSELSYFVVDLGDRIDLIKYDTGKDCELHYVLSFPASNENGKLSYTLDEVVYIVQESYQAVDWICN